MNDTAADEARGGALDVGRLDELRRSHLTFSYFDDTHECWDGDGHPCMVLQVLDALEQATARVAHLAAYVEEQSLSWHCASGHDAAWATCESESCVEDRAALATPQTAGGAGVGHVPLAEWCCSQCGYVLFTPAGTKPLRLCPNDGAALAAREAPAP